MKEDYILGLDIGTNSVGWAVVACVKNADDQWSPTNLIDLNSYIFQEVVNAKDQVPINAIRRQKRLARRQIKRRAKRRTEMIKILWEYGLLPKDKNYYLSEQQANNIDNAFAERFTASGKHDKSKLDEQIKQYSNPFAIRAMGVTHELEPYEIGRAILHLQSHRGYRSNTGAKYVELLEILDIEEDKGNEDDPNASVEEKNEKKTVLGGISKLEEEMRQVNVETVGQYIWHKAQTGEELKRITGYSVKEKIIKEDTEEEYDIALYARRDMTKKEFDLIWKKQKHIVKKAVRGMGSDDSIEEIRNIIQKKLFEQYPVQSPPPQKRRQKHLSYNSAGKCILEPDKGRGRAAWPEAQEFRIRQIINNLQVNRKYLSQEQKDKLFKEANDIEKLNADGILIWKNVANCLGINRKDLNYLDEGDSKSGLIGNRTKKKMSKVLGDKNHEEYIEDVITMVNKRALYNRLVKRGLTSGKDGEAFNLSMLELETAYMKYSLKAIRKLLPHMQGGKNLHDSLESCGYNKAENNNNKSPRSLLLNRPIPQIANPRVQKAAHATRRVINAIIKRYGKRPVQINIEMARELKASKKHRKVISARHASNRDMNTVAEKKLSSENIPVNNSNRREYISKYKCWHDEQNCQCAYCGKTMALHEVFQDGRNQWEHILPQSEFKQNYLNRVVACWDCNNHKGNRTPYQAWGHTATWETIKKNMDGWTNMPKEKKKRILMTGDVANSEDFCTRALNDTRYITKFIAEYIRRQAIRVQVSKGMATSELRYNWGLHNILPDPDATKTESEQTKSRIDHRHHAVDAFVVALTSHKVLMRLTEYMQYERDYMRGDSENIRKNTKANKLKAFVPATWKGGKMRNTVQDIILTKNVAIQKKTKIQGALHEETVYGRSHYTILEPVPKRISISYIDRIGRILEYKPDDKGTIADDGDIEWISDPKIYEDMQSWYEENKAQPANKRRLPAIGKLPVTHRCYVLRISLENAIQYVKSSEWVPGTKRWIADQELHRVIYNWKENNNLLKSSEKDVKKALESMPIRMYTTNGKQGHIIKAVRIAMKFSATGTGHIDGRGCVQLGNNHHIDIFINQTKNKRKIRIVSAMETALRQSRKEPVINKQPDISWDNSWEYQTTLYRGDLIKFDKDDSLLPQIIKDQLEQYNNELKSNIYRVQKFSSTANGAPDISFRLVSIATTDNNHGLIRIRSANHLAIKRIEMGVLGLDKEDC